jgi:hypothetical protein
MHRQRSDHSGSAGVIDAEPSELLVILGSQGGSVDLSLRCVCLAKGSQNVYGAS